MGNKIICLDWDLYETTTEAFRSKDNFTHYDFSDIREVAKCIRVYGTKDQVKAIENQYKIDESYEFKVEKKGSYWYGIFGSRAESINEATEKKLQELQVLYELNNNEILILRTR
jgi:hypothetical protein